MREFYIALLILILISQILGNPTAVVGDGGGSCNKRVFIILNLYLIR